MPPEYLLLRHANQPHQGYPKLLWAKDEIVFNPSLTILIRSFGLICLLNILLLRHANQPHQGYPKLLYLGKRNNNR